MARFKDILKIRDNILITCYTIKIFGVAKKPRGLYCRTKLKTIEWQIHHISTYEVRFAIIQLIAKIIATGHNEVLLYIKYTREDTFVSLLEVENQLFVSRSKINTSSASKIMSQWYQIPTHHKPKVPHRVPQSSSTLVLCASCDLRTTKAYTKFNGTHAF